jgi:hypothetical protein
MATSGTTAFNLDIDEIVEEAFERCGMRVTTGYQLSSARRSLNILFLEWANRGLNLWTIERFTTTLTSGVEYVDLPTNVVNVLEAVIRDITQSPAIDISIERISRADYLNLPNKTTDTARPSQFYVERTNTPRVYFYPSPNANYQFIHYRITRIEDAGNYENEADVNFRFLPCMVAGLAFHLSIKFAPEKAQYLKAMYEEEFSRAASEDRDTASTYFLPDVGA